METEALGIVVKTAKAFEDLGIIGIMFIWIVYREYQHYKFSKSTTDELIKSSNALYNLTDKINQKIIESNVNNAKNIELLGSINTELKQNNEVNKHLIEYVKDTCVGVKVRLDKLDDKLDEIDKKIIALK